MLRMSQTEKFKSSTKWAVAGFHGSFKQSFVTDP
jgi:hypothetical protein